MVRRGPLAAPTATEQLEYLFTRVPKKDSRKDFEKHALEHVLSYQRRIHTIKRHFLQRGKRTPLGITQDYWDRTEAQQRGSLHAHILAWFRKRQRPHGWQKLPAIPSKSKRKGADAKQRAVTDRVAPLKDDEYQEDSIYQLNEIARISGEMPRADVRSSTTAKWGGFDCGSLRVAGLARSVLIKLNYHHVCTPAYCLLNRSCCRFFFPWSNVLKSDIRLIIRSVCFPWPL